MASSIEWRRFPLGGLAGGDRTVVETDGREILLVRFERGLVALDNACPHQGNPLVEGDVLGTTLVCAFHGWRFDLETGACLLGDEAVRRYEAEIRGDELWIGFSS